MVRYYELLVENTVFRDVDLSPDGNRRVFYTDQFQHDLSIYRVNQELTDFLNFKINPENKFTSYGKKDDIFHYTLKGYWHCHLVHGRVILIYSLDNTHLELYRLVDHKEIDSQKQMKMILTFIDNLDRSRFKELHLFQSRIFPSNVFSEIDNFLQSLIYDADDRKLLEEYVATGSGLILDYIHEIANLENEQDSKQFLMQWRKRFGKSIVEYVKQLLTYNI